MQAAGRSVSPIGTPLVTDIPRKAAVMDHRGADDDRLDDRWLLRLHRRCLGAEIQRDDFVEDFHSMANAAHRAWRRIDVQPFRSGIVAFFKPPDSRLVQG